MTDVVTTQRNGYTITRHVEELKQNEETYAPLSERLEPGYWRMEFRFQLLPGLDKNPDPQANTLTFFVFFGRIDLSTGKAIVGDAFGRVLMGRFDSVQSLEPNDFGIMVVLKSGEKHQLSQVLAQPKIQGEDDNNYWSDWRDHFYGDTMRHAVDWVNQWICNYDIANQDGRNKLVVAARTDTLVSQCMNNIYIV
jgi:hypothetical protein